MTAINPKVIGDLRALQTAGAPGFLTELIDLFLKEAGVNVVALQDSLGSRNAPAFERAAHTLKGSAGNLGAQAMSRICAELQSIGRAADWEKASQLLPELEREFVAVKSELEAEKARG